MKNKLYVLVFLAFLVGIISCKKENRPAELHIDSSEIIFDKYTNTKYFTVVNTGNSTMDFQISSSEDYVLVSPSNGVLGFNETAKIQVDVDRQYLDFGLYTSNLWLTSNGGTRVIDVNVFNPLPNPPVLWWELDYLKIESYEEKEYIIIANDGEQPLEFQINSPASWISFSQNSGTLSAGQELKVWINANREGLNSNLYTSVININSNGGDAQVLLDMEVDIYSVTFFNPTYTPIEIGVSGFPYNEIPVLDRVNFVYSSNPGSIDYFAKTEGESVGGQVLGLTLTWDENIYLEDGQQAIFDLNISDYFFFLSVKNYGAHDLDLWSINYDTDYQFDEDVLIPNDGYEYNFGYYDALDNSIIYARIVGTQYDAVWENGYEFDFPWTMNQAILLESDQKKSANIITNRIFDKSGETQTAIKLTPKTQAKIRARNAESLINKR